MSERIALSAKAGGWPYGIALDGRAAAVKAYRKAKAARRGPYVSWAKDFGRQSPFHPRKRP